MKTKNLTKRMSVWAVIVTGILLIPYIARFPWTAGDFIFAGVVLYGSAAAYELITKNMKNSMQRIAVAAGVSMVVLLIWAWAVA